MVRRLSKKVLDEIDIPDSALEKMSENIKKVNKAIIKDLKREFESRRTILEAAMANKPEFDDALVLYLKIHLRVLLSPTRKKNPVLRFFSAVGKALAMPFRCCFKGNCCD